MKAPILAALALLALALPAASEAQVYARGGNVNRGGFAGGRGVAVVRDARVLVARPRVVVVQPARRVGFLGRVRAGVRAFRGR